MGNINKVHRKHKCPYCGQLFSDDELVDGKLPKDVESRHHDIGSPNHKCPYVGKNPVPYNSKEPLLRGLSRVCLK